MGGIGNGPRAGAAEMSELKWQPAVCCVAYLDMFV